MESSAYFLFGMSRQKFNAETKLTGQVLVTVKIMHCIETGTEAAELLRQLSGFS